MKILKTRGMANFKSRLFPAKHSIKSKDNSLRSMPLLIVNKTLVIMLAILLATSGLLAIHFSKVNAYNAPTILGELPYQKLLSHRLSDRVNLLVNAANGNVVLQSLDMNINGTQLPFSITRYFNDQATNSGMVGSRNTLGIGSDVHITSNSDGSATYQGPSGFQVNYPANGSGGYTASSNFTAATLSKVTGGGWTLKYNQSNETYTFNASGNLTKDTTANGEAINYTYNANGTLASATDTQGRVTTFGTYSGNNVGQVTFPSNNGNYIFYHYNPSGQLTSMSDATGTNWYYGYDANGNLNSIQDPRGIITTLSYNAAKQVTAITYNSNNAGGSTANTFSYAYNAGNTVQTDPLTHITTYNYDTSGRVTSVVDALGVQHGASWDGNNNLTSLTDPSNKATSLAYDQLNNLLSVQNPSLANGGQGAKTSYTYGSSSQPNSPTASTDTQGNQVAYSYNTNGNLLSATSSAAGGTGMGTTSKTYQGDPNGSGGTVNCGAQAGQTCTAKDAIGNITNYGYDAAGNVTTVTPPNAVGKETITYDVYSRPITITDGNSSTKTIAYDRDSRPTSLAYAKDGSNIYYQYDGNGNLTSVNGGASGITNYTYDGNNRITAISAGVTTLNYTYDAASNLKTEQGPGGTTTYNYDNANQISSLQQSSTGKTVSFGFTNGRPSSVTFPGAVIETINYDQAGRETSISAARTSTTLTSYTGSYVNALGQDTGLLQTLVNNVASKTTNYSYDGLNRLIGASQSGTGSDSYTYTYDKNGNITQNSHNGTASPTFGYNADNELTTVNGATSGSFDLEGNQTSTRAGLAMTYNAKNQTSSFTPPSSAAISATYSDADQKNRTQIGSTTEVNGLLGLYSDTTSGTTTYYTHLPSGTHQVVGETIGTTPYYLLTDLQGSVISLTDGAGNVQNTYNYDPYGNLLSSTGTVTNPWRYDGGYFDSNTGLYKFGVRYYNPADGRWTQLDPSAQNPGYVFAGDDPVNQVDPTGTFSLKAFGKAYIEGCAAGIGSTAGYAVVTAYATGGQIEISGLELALGCSFGGAAAAYDTIIPNGGNGIRDLDNTTTLLGY